jgi:site-specific DNA-methyltransferase (adenine-specific)
LKQKQDILVILLKIKIGFMEYKYFKEKSQQGNSKVYLMDCMDALKQTPDKYYSLACVDPPYDFSINKNAFVSLSKNNKKQETRNGSFKIGGNYVNALSEPPNEKYFKELMRVSENQIVFGGNYFIDKLYNSSCWIVWDKNNGGSYFSDCELAWTSFTTTIRMYKKTTHSKDKIHPTQKPVSLYEWILANYAKPNDKILDTHLGSGSSRIAAYKHNLDFTAFELDKDYFDAQEKRFKNFIAQTTLF